MNHHPRIFIAGCGYTGERCAEFFCADGCDVTALVSSEASARRLAGRPVAVIAADAADPDRLRARTEGCAPVDVLVHCLSGHTGRDAAAYRITYVETLRNLLDILAPRFCIFTGSTSVYPQNDGGTVTEASPAGGSPTADVLLEAEALALASGGAVVRLGGIYGPGRDRFVRSALAGEPFPGAPAAFINFIHRDDAARALFHVASHRLRGIFNAVDNHPAPRAALAEAIRENTPPAVSTAPATGRRVSNAKLRASGWTPLHPWVSAAAVADG